MKSAPHHLLEKWKEFLHYGFFIDYKEGQYLFYGGHLPYGLFLPLEGDICYLKEENGKEICMGHASLTEEIGMECLMNETPYNFTAYANKPTRVFFISKSHFLKDKALFEHLSWKGSTSSTNEAH